MLQKKMNSLHEDLKARDFGRNLVLVQSIFRRNSAMSLLKKSKQATVLIQAKIRGWKQRRWYLITRRRLIVLQAHVRRHLARKKYLAMREKIIMLQTVTRSFLQRKTYLKRLSQITVIQSLLRRRRALKLARQLAQEKLPQLRKPALEAMVTLKLSHFYRAQMIVECERRGYLSTLVSYRSLVATLRWASPLFSQCSSFFLILLFSFSFFPAPNLWPKM